jgi:hypothetical protein
LVICHIVCVEEISDEIGYENYTISGMAINMILMGNTAKFTANKK